MPRSGNTLFGSLMNQNNNIKVTPNSPCAFILKDILKIKQEQIFKNFPDYKGIDSVMINFFKNYYQHYNCKNILDRGPWSLSPYYQIIKQMYNDVKFVILYRPFLEVLSSFVLLDKPKDIDTYCDNIVNNQYALNVMDNLNAIRNLKRFKENYIVVHYKDLIKKTDEELKKVCNFLNIPFVKPDYDNIEQFNINGIFYDDSQLSNNFHTIHTKSIKQNTLDIEKILPNEVIHKYKNFDINFEQEK